MEWNYELIPEAVMRALLRYRDEGCPTGSFTEAVISGDLYEAVRRGDDHSLAGLNHMAAWIESNMPRGAYSSRAHYKGWIKLFDDLRKMGNTDVRYNHNTGKLIYEEPLTGAPKVEANA